MTGSPASGGGRARVALYMKGFRAPARDMQPLGLGWTVWQIACLACGRRAGRLGRRRALSALRK